MSIVVIIAILIAVVIVLPRMFSSDETKLFRRVWSAQKVGGQVGQTARLAAIQSLATRYGVDFDKDSDDVRQAIGRLLADATNFDVRYRNNFGVQVMPIIATSLLALKGYRHPEITDDLLQMSRVDGIRLMDAFNSSES